jgi:ABC-type phosphate/phosphonate transport system substrate-binding protein
MPTRLTLSYYPWITQSISGGELARAIAVFRDLLQEKLRALIGSDTTIEVLKELEVPDQLTELASAPAAGVHGKIGLLNPIGYAIAHSEHPHVVAIAVIRRRIGREDPGPTYKAQVYTHKRTAIRELKKTRGRTMAFGSPQSTSNFLVPADMLWKAGVHPMNGFARVEFTGGHDKAAVAVYEGRLEVGAGHDGAIIDLSNRPGYGDAQDVLVPLEWSAPIPSDPVAVNVADQGLREAILGALVAVADPKDSKSPGNEAVHAFWGTREGFQSVDAEAYSPLLALMQSFALRPDDMLRKL